jgi:hypothetical protein
MCFIYTGPYLIVVSQREEVGTILGVPIFEVAKASIIQVARNANSLTEDEVCAHATHKPLLLARANLAYARHSRSCIHGLLIWPDHKYNTPIFLIVNFY